MQWQKPMAETYFCRTGLNRFKPRFKRFKLRFKPPLAETCQPCPRCLHTYVWTSRQIIDSSLAYSLWLCRVADGRELD